MQKNNDTQVKNVLVEEFMGLVNKSTNQIMATLEVEKLLNAEGYYRLLEEDHWDDVKGKFYVKRSDSSIIAFEYTDETVGVGFNLIGAHTDSPGLKIKPNPRQDSKDYLQLGVEVYGGPILSTWFDRDLSIAGRVCVLDKDGSICKYFIDFKRPIAIIPNLAIHLNRKTNDGAKFDKQKDLTPIFAAMSKSEIKEFNFESFLEEQIKEEYINSEVVKVLEHDLYLYPTEKASLLGINNELLAAPRLDNLLNCFMGLKALIDSKASNKMLLLFDNEECGSESRAGANSTFFNTIFKRILAKTGEEGYFRSVSNSFLISADNAHAVHPNYSSCHDNLHQPVINGGPVIKYNSNQRYTSTSYSSAKFQKICMDAKVPFQKFVSNNEMGCGSTIGPMISSISGIPSVDIGAPTLAMHSTRELMGSDDLLYIYQVFLKFFDS